jgi:hypothetical protein
MKHHRHYVMLVALALSAATIGSRPVDASQNLEATAGGRIDRGAYIDDAAAFQALQDAVDTGGTVVVNGVFTLADGQSLIVGRSGHDVTIKADPSGGTLVGGTNTIHQIGVVEMTLAGMTVLASRGAYVLVEATSGTTVRRCQLMGLVLSPGVGAVGVRVENLPGADAADLLIVDNFIDAGNTRWSLAAMNVGILVQRVQMDLNATIAGNRIEAAQTAGIFVNDSNGSYTIQKNRISMTGDPTKGPWTDQPLNLWAIGVWGRSVSRAVRSFVVAHNEIEATNSVAAVGYASSLEDVADPPTVLVHQNKVRVIDGVFSTFLLHGNVDGSVWKQNRVDGSTVNVFAMLNATNKPAQGNLFAKNHIDVDLLVGTPHPYMGEVPSTHLYFGIGADDNFAEGFERLDVVDQGLGNIVR